MGFLSGACPKCGLKVSRFSKFCSHCGEGSASLFRLCPSCNRAIRAGAKFCTKCGEPVKVEGSAAAAAQVWRRVCDPVSGKPVELASRFDLEDLRGAYREGFVVEEGTRALLLVGGRLERVLAPGAYAGPAADAAGKTGAPSPATVVLVDASDLVLEVAANNARAADEIAGEAAARLVLRLADPAAFLTAVWRGRETVGFHELETLVRPEAEEALAALVRSRPAVELDLSVEPHVDVEKVLRARLEATLGRLGLELVQVRTFAFRSAALEKERDERAATALKRERVETLERRLEVLDRLQKAANAEEMDKVTNAEELARFLHGVDKERLLRKEEMEDLVRAYGEKKDDRALARRHLREKLDTEHALALEELRREKELAGARAKRDLARTIRADKVALEVERAKGLWAASAEALIAVSGGEQARAIAEMRKGEAAHSKEMYEKMLRMQQATFQQAMDVAARTAGAVAAAATGRAAVGVVVPAAETNGSCKSCGAAMARGAAFCEGCGARHA